jgi:hypothetical protein
MEYILTAEARLLVGDHSYRQEPADAHTIVWRRALQKSLEWSEAEGLPDELGESSVCAVGQGVDDAHEGEEVCLRVCNAYISSDLAHSYLLQVHSLMLLTLESSPDLVHLELGPLLPVRSCFVPHGPQ